MSRYSVGICAVQQAALLKLVGSKGKEKEAAHQHVADLKAQLAQLREDNGYLKTLIDIMAGRWQAI